MVGFGYLSSSCKSESSISITGTSNQNPQASSSSNSDSTPLPKIKNPQKPIKQQIQHFHYRDLEFATNGFSTKKLLGKGSHGSVYKAAINGRLFAVKKPSRGLNEVDNEIEILSKIHNPRLVNLVGFSNDDDGGDDRIEKRLLVVEFMSNGTLYDALHSNSKPALSWGRRIRLALQSAKAIDTIHTANPPVIHRDIKSANVLIDEKFNARLSDFGLAVMGYVDDYRVLSTPPAGTMGYLDPSYVTPDNLSTKSDVFSFGILLLEIISGRKAIDVGYSPPSIVDWAIPLIRKGKFVAIYDARIPPPNDPIVRKQMAIIAAKCVRSCKERRPSMNEVVDWLNGLSKLASLSSWKGFTNPCLMVETIGTLTPVDSTIAHLNSKLSCTNYDANDDANHDWDAMKNSRRVYSDLGFKKNLMDLIIADNEVDPKAKSSNWSARFRFGSGRFVDSGNLDDTTVIHRRRNQSLGHISELHASKRR